MAVDIKDIIDISLSKEAFYNKYGRNKHLAAKTLGCKVNSYETDYMIERFEEKGYEIVGEEEVADVYLINTCTVTKLSDRKSRQFIRRAKHNNPDAIVAVVGCYVQVAPEEVAAIEEVDIIAGTADKYRVADMCEDFIKNKKEKKIVEVDNIMNHRIYDEVSISNVEGRTRAYIKIQEGCNNYCSYCIIPFARGPVRSRQIDDIVKEVKHISAKGYKEIVLTGIHVASYGKDIKAYGLVDVIEQVAAVEGIERVRLSSMEPTYVTADFIARMEKLDNFCPHFHLSLQSGSDTVLQRMNRKYTTADYIQAVENIRKVYPQAGITTDIIVGFPGETESEFNETLAFVEKIKFSELHVFRYSPREGTKAAEMQDQVDGNIKNARSNQLIELGKKEERRFRELYVGQEIDVLLEATSEGKVEGYTKNYMKVEIENGSHAQEGMIYRVQIIAYDGEVLKAQML